MAKGKSSATSATRKKHAKKAAGPEDPAIFAGPLPKKQKGKKGEKAAPKIKQYIPPTRPTPVQPDPLDSLGLAHVLDQELVVTLRRLGKKDAITRGKAVEELRTWVDRDETDNSVNMIPVWLHHFPALIIHSSRRIRLLASSLHDRLLSIPVIRSTILFYITETADAPLSEAILGTWCMSAWDIDRTVSREGKRSWARCVVWNHELDEEASSRALSLGNAGLVEGLSDFVSNALLAPDSLYLRIFPPAPPAPAAIIPHGRRIPGRQPIAPRAVVEDESVRNPESEEENEDDRRARLRAGALGSIKWLLDTYPASTPTPKFITTLLHRTLSDSTTFTALHPAPRPALILPPGQLGLGHGQPMVRRAAWAVVQSLAVPCRDEQSLAPYLPYLCRYVLDAAWLEPDPNVRLSMWEPLLTFLTKVPNVWLLAQIETPAVEIGAESEESDHEDDDSDFNDGEDEVAPKPTETPRESPRFFYDSFLRFLQLGCGGSPIQGYSTLVVILSTIPPEILPLTQSGLAELFTSFWAALDARTLGGALEKERRDSIGAFLSSLLECVTVYARNLAITTPSTVNSSNDLASSDNRELALALVIEQWNRIWSETLAGRLRLPEPVIGQLLGKELVRLHTLDSTLFETAWGPISSPLVVSRTTPSTVDVISILSAIDTSLHLTSADTTVISTRLQDLVHDRSHEILSTLIQHAIRKDPAGEGQLIISIVHLFEKFHTYLLKNSDILILFDQVFEDHLSSLLTIISPVSFVSLLHVYLNVREEKGHDAWSSVLEHIGHAPITPATGITPISMLNALLEESPTLPTTLHPRGGELDRLVLHSMDAYIPSLGISSNTDIVDTINLEQLILRAAMFVDASVVQNLKDRVSFVIVDTTQRLLRDSDSSLGSLDLAISLVAGLSAHSPDTSGSINRFSLDAIPSVFLLSHILPNIGNQQEVVERTYSHWASHSSSSEKSAIGLQIRKLLRDALTDVNVRITPIDILDIASKAPESTSLEVTLAEILPLQESFDTHLTLIATHPVHPSLSVIDSLVPSRSDSAKYRHPYVYDAQGYSSYARITVALLQVIAEDRQIARRNLWSIPHLLGLDIFASDFAANPGAPSPLFDSRQGPDIVRQVNSIVVQTHQTATYVLSSLSGDLPVNWHREVTSGLRGANAKNFKSLHESANFIRGVYNASLASDGVFESRIFHRALRGILREAKAEDGDLWLALAQTVQDKAVQTPMAIVLCISGLNLESPRLDRYRNELASRLAGVSPKNSSTEGSRLLRLLNVAAPSSDSDVVFLPQQRTIFMIQALQKWVSSDLDLEEEIESQMALLFLHLAPLIQSVPGAHWDLIADLIELNLENASFRDDSTLATLYRTLKLLTEVEDLVSSNKALRETWSDRQPRMYDLIKNLLVIPVGDLPNSSPRNVCRGLVVSLATQIPGSLVDDDSFRSVCHLLQDSALDVRKAAHQVLHEAAEKYTEKLILEAEVDTTEDLKIEIPPELLEMLQMTFADMGVESDIDEDCMPYLLAWMITFDLFENASPKVKNGYGEQLRNANIVPDNLLPVLFMLLRIGSGGKPFPVDPWAIDEFHVDLLDDSLPTSLRILAAHVYYRALVCIPSLIRTWWLECKDRQLSGAIGSFTSSQFSPVLIAHQLSDVKSPRILGELQDDALSVKVASAVHEVIVSYAIDDQQMEIGVRLPGDYPLHGVEVKDLKRVGVQEGKWRGWLFNVQQIAQSGLIVDALFWFKKNVSLHFEGKVECAICYSIISVMDRTLPNKPCKTCKNRFHGSCLYKWFHTSHSSSCPLCRSDIF